MSDKSLIEWCDATVNAVNGCSVISPGCTNCYAMRLAGTRLKNRPTCEGLTVQSKTGPVWNGTVRLNDTALKQPLAWRRPRRILWNAHGDLFHPAVPDEWIDKVFAICALTPHHTHMILTKRSARMRDYVNAQVVRIGAMLRTMDSLVEDGWKQHKRWPLRNVWLGISIEDREHMLERGPDLAACLAAIRFWSAEPLLGDLGTIDRGIMPDWVIIGAEFGPGARPMSNQWAQSIVDQCQGANTSVFVQQLSSGGSKAMKDIDAFPDGLRLRQYPHGGGAMHQSAAPVSFTTQWRERRQYIPKRWGAGRPIGRPK